MLLLTCKIYNSIFLASPLDLRGLGSLLPSVLSIILAYRLVVNRLSPKNMHK
nr:MAG TPA: hypothetical protein [Caudoviricetes sp.]